MNEKLQKVYYLIGIVQRISMVVLTFLMMGAAYKIYALSLQYDLMFQGYGVEIRELHRIVLEIQGMLHRSIFF